MKISQLLRTAVPLLTILHGPLLLHGDDTNGDFTQTLRGKVIDVYTEQPVPGANVVLPDTEPLIGTTTDANGEFRFEDLPVGRIDLKVSMMGYEPAFARNLLLTSGRELVVTISLEEKVFQLDDVVVTPEFRKDQAVNEMAMVSARSFTVEETERYAGSLGDPSRMASNFAGVSNPSDQRNDIIIRGNSPLGLLWRLEGIEIPNPNHFGSMGSTGGPVSMLNNNLLTNSDFFTAAFPAEYGDAMAGVFDLKMRNGNNQQREYIGQVGFNGFELGAEGPFSNESQASYLVNFRYSTLEVMNAIGLDFGTGTAIPKYKDLSFKINVPLDNGRITLFGLGGDNNIEFVESEADAEEADYGFTGSDLYYDNRMGVTGLTHVHHVNDNSRFTTNLAVTGIENSTRIFDLGSDIDEESIIQNNHEIKYTLSTKYTHRFNVKNHLNAGLIYDHYDVKYEGQSYNKQLEDYIKHLDTRGDLGYARAFAEWKHRFSDEVSMTSGLHGYYMFHNNTYSVDPRMAMKWEFREGQSVNLGAGLHSQSQQKFVYFGERLVDTLAVAYEQTNKDLDFSRSLHLVAGYDRLLGENHRLKAEMYYQKLFDIPVSPLRPEFSLISQGGGFVFIAFDYMENTGTGENKGVELTLEKFLSEGFYYLFTASVFDSGYRGYDGEWRNSAFNNNYVLNLLGGYEWELSQRSIISVDISTVLAGGNRILPIDEEASIENNGVVYDWDNVYAEQFDDYFRLNARITYRLNGQNINQEWALDLQNLTDHQNIFTRNWNSSNQEVSTSYQMGFSPMMTYRIYF
ncbi:MAG: TonB-dependent receptor [Bacteroidales bacterium]